MDWHLAPARRGGSSRVTGMAPSVAPGLPRRAARGPVPKRHGARGPSRPALNLPAAPVVLAALLAALWTSPTPAAAFPGRFPGHETPFPYVAARTNVSDALDVLSEAVGVPVDASEVRGARVSERVTGETAGAFLDALADQANLDWYYDGQTLHVSPVARRRTLVLPLEGRRPAAVVSRLEALGVHDARFPLRGDGAEGVAMLVAPPRYANLVEQLFPEIPVGARGVVASPRGGAAQAAGPSGAGGSGLTVEVIRGSSRSVQTVPR